MNTMAMRQVFGAFRKVRGRADKDVLRIDTAEVAQEIEKGLVLTEVPAGPGQGADQAGVVWRTPQGFVEVDEGALIITAPAQQFRQGDARRDIAGAPASDSSASRSRRSNTLSRLMGSGSRGRRLPQLGELGGEFDPIDFDAVVKLAGRLPGDFLLDPFEVL